MREWLHCLVPYPRSQEASWQRWPGYTGCRFELMLKWNWRLSSALAITLVAKLKRWGGDTATPLRSLSWSSTRRGAQMHLTTCNESWWSCCHKASFSSLGYTQYPTQGDDTASVRMQLCTIVSWDACKATVRRASPRCSFGQVPQLIGRSKLYACRSLVCD